MLACHDLVDSLCSICMQEPMLCGLTIDASGVRDLRVLAVLDCGKRTSQTPRESPTAKEAVVIFASKWEVLIFFSQYYAFLVVSPLSGRTPYSA